MTRFKLTIEYDGAGFVGWQRQDNGPSVQQALEDAVAAFSGERVAVQGAGRTDSGVHATGQVAHLDLAGDPAGRDRDGDTLRDALNFHLKPRPVAVLAAEAVGDDFHARFSAVGRRYRYRILSRRAPLALDRGRAWFVPRPLDAAAMHEAAQVLVGEHDFTSFRAAGCQARSPVKTLDRLAVTRGGLQGDPHDGDPHDSLQGGSHAGDEIRVEAAARSFLHRQVRNLVGTLRLVGEGKWGPARVAEALARRDRAAAGPTAPADGLYLVEVRY